MEGIKLLEHLFSYVWGLIFFGVALYVFIIQALTKHLKPHRSVYDRKNGRQQ